ncbi:NfeD family protein [Risungbinella massiliensis]|uniref:NfeD family protein n=1 Tax=Risungbinella massiliensis TaxID=1329796 RepID=UPI00069B8793|nr:NfeD family protein [Risungbinella massiliensis]
MNDWIVYLAEWITNPAVMSLLLWIGLIGLVVELLAPGHLLGGIVGVVAFSIYFAGHWIAGTPNEYAPYIFVAGLLLFGLEALVPSFGFFGILATVALVYSVVVVAESVSIGFTALGIGIGGTILCLWILYRFFGFRTTWSRIILKDTQRNQEGFTSARDRTHLLGKIGRTVTPLRPSGWAVIEDRREDVVSEGEMIPAQRRVKVVHVEGSRVVVRSILETEIVESEEEKI